MKRTSVLLLLLLLLSQGVGSAQTEKGEWKRPKHGGKITTEYDRDNDQTKLSLGIMPVTCIREACIFINLIASFPGAKLKAPVENITLGLSLVTMKLKPLADPKLVFRLDGEPLDLGAMTFAGEVPAGELTGLPYGVLLKGDDLAKLANARKVEVEMGGLRFALNENTLNAIKDYNHQARAVE